MLDSQLEEESDHEFFVAKKDQREISSESEEEDEEEQKKMKAKVNKQMTRKITADGPL